MPVFNEAKTVAIVLKKLLKVTAVKEIIVVDDGSTDKTASKIKKVLSKKIKYLHKKNGGKGSAVRLGLKKVTQEYVLIQDADLEYDPEDIELLIAPLQKGRVRVVFGSRFLGARLNLLFWHWVGNSLINTVTNILYNTTISDLETCYKVLPTKVFRSLNITSNSFDLEPEITCKLLRRGFKIFEVPITYIGRDYSEGKKITWWDGFSALKTIIWLRFQ